MPKVRRKRRTTSSNRLTRPKRTRAKTSEETPVEVTANSLTSSINQNQQTKAVYFDLVANPNDSIKSKSTGNSIKLPKPPRSLKVSDDWDVKPGDVLSWSSGRPTETFFVTSEGTLLKNPDTSASGYLTIPLSITSQFPDTLDYFSAVLDGVGRDYTSSIELAPTDAFFAAHFSKQPLPASIKKRNDISYSFDPNDEVLNVILSDQSAEQFAIATAKLDDILQWISAGNETKAKLVVKYNFDGKQTCSKVPRGIVAGLPAGWQCQQQGSMMYGDNKIQGEWKCEGPEKTKEKAQKAIEKHYKGLNVEIE